MAAWAPHAAPHAAAFCHARPYFSSRSTTAAPANVEPGRRSSEGGALCPLTLFPRVRAAMVGIPKNAGSTLHAVLRRALGDWEPAEMTGDGRALRPVDGRARTPPSH
eukprot:3150519-Prymnesium_polylepis.1